MRRHLIEQPVSRAAIWSRRLAWFAWLSVVGTLVLARFGRLMPYQTLTVLLACAAIAGIAIGLAVLAFTVIWRNGSPGAGIAAAGLILALALLAYPAASCLRDLLDPAPMDVTTDPNDPPPAPQRAAPTSAGPVAASRTAAGVPTAIQPALIDASIDAALATALRTAGASGWHVTQVDYPRQPERDEASFAATVPSLLIRWPSDAVVRLTATDDGVRVDVRLIARQPWSLLRSGDADIVAYFDRIDTPTTVRTPQAGR